MNDYQLVINMLLNGFGDDQIVAASDQRFLEIADKIRWWGNIGVIPVDYVESTVNYFVGRRSEENSALE